MKPLTNSLRNLMTLMQGAVTRTSHTKCAIYPIPGNALSLPPRFRTGAEKTAYAHQLERTVKPAAVNALLFFRK